MIDAIRIIEVVSFYCIKTACKNISEADLFQRPGYNSIRSLIHRVKLGAERARVYIVHLM